MIVYLIIIANVVASIAGFSNKRLFEKYLFHVGKVLAGKEYIRLFTSGFLHVDWMHLLFNMMSLFFFGPAVMNEVGVWQFLLIYFASLFGGNFLSLFVHRHKFDYRAVGASGAVSGILFAIAAIAPLSRIQLFFFFPMPVWIYTIVFVLISIYGIKKQSGNVGHEAHLGGGLIGLVTVLILVPSLMKDHLLYILIILLPSVTFIALLILKPNVLLTKDIIRRSTQGLQTIDDEYNEKKVQRQKEIDRILDKINERGIKSLSAEEKRKLDEFSNN